MCSRTETEHAHFALFSGLLALLFSPPPLRQSEGNGRAGSPLGHCRTEKFTTRLDMGLRGFGSRHGHKVIFPVGVPNNFRRVGVTLLVRLPRNFLFIDVGKAVRRRTTSCLANTVREEARKEGEGKESGRLSLCSGGANWIPRRDRTTLSPDSAVV